MFAVFLPVETLGSHPVSRSHHFRVAPSTVLERERERAGEREREERERERERERQNLRVLSLCISSFVYR